MGVVRDAVGSKYSSAPRGQHCRSLRSQRSTIACQRTLAEAENDEKRKTMFAVDLPLLLLLLLVRDLVPWASWGIPLWLQIGRAHV